MRAVDVVMIAAAGYVGWRLISALDSMGAQGVARGLVKGAAGAATGVVTGAGDVLGIPATDVAKCTCAIANGEAFEASKFCSAGVFAGALAGKRPFVLKRSTKGTGAAIWPNFNGKPVLFAARQLGAARWTPVTPTVMPDGWQRLPAWT